MKRWISILCMVFLLTGCTEDATEDATIEYETDWEVTDTIHLEVIDSDTGKEVSVAWIGKENKIAITNNPFYEENANKYMWLLWGEESDIVNKEFKVIATSEAGKELTVIESTLGGANWGAIASARSTITLPTEGLWKLDAYVSDQLFETIVVKVHKKA